MGIALSLAVFTCILCESRYLTALCINHILSANLCLDTFKHCCGLAWYTIVVAPHNEGICCIRTNHCNADIAAQRKDCIIVLKQGHGLTRHLQ